MNRLMNALPTRIYFLIMVFLTSFRAQSLYETDYQQYSNLNREGKEVSVQSLLGETEALLKKKTSDLQKLVDIKEDAYNELITMHSQGQFPDEARIDELCARHPKLIIKSMTGCHRYYNCSGEDTELSRWTSIYRLWHSKFEHECHYPFLFSDETMQCENYTEVSCLNRYEPTWECRYFRLTCKPGMHCDSGSCGRKYITCEDKEDGLQPSPHQQLHYPNYITCDKGRRIHEGRCPVDALWGVQSFPYNGQCIQLFGVPTVYNPHGLLPSCNGTVDGNYPFTNGSYCFGYYKCEGGVATAVKCPSRTIFDTDKRICDLRGSCNL